MREVWKCASSKIERVGWMRCPPRLWIAIKRPRCLCSLQIGLAEQILSEWRKAWTIIKGSKFIKTHTRPWSCCLQSGPHRHLKWCLCLSWRLKLKSNSHSRVILSYFILVLVPFRALQCIFMPSSAFALKLLTIFRDNCRRLMGWHVIKKNITPRSLLMTQAFIPEAHVHQTPRRGGLFVFAMLRFYWGQKGSDRLSALQPMKQEHQAQTLKDILGADSEWMKRNHICLAKCILCMPQEDDPTIRDDSSFKKEWRQNAILSSSSSRRNQNEALWIHWSLICYP